MSWEKEETSSTEMEENPDPEDDSDLVQWHRQDNHNADHRVEHDCPEEDSVLEHEEVSHNTAPVISSGGVLVPSAHRENFSENRTDSVNEPMSMGEVCQLGMQHASHESDRTETVVFAGEESARQSGSCNSNEDTIADGDCSISSNHEASLSCSSHESKEPHLTAQQKVTTTVLTSNNACNKIAVSCTATCHIDLLEDPGNDAPESEAVGSRLYTSEEEDNLHVVSFQQCEEHQPPTSNTDLVMATRFGTEPETWTHHENLDLELQVPECDRQANVHPIELHNHSFSARVGVPVSMVECAHLGTDCAEAQLISHASQNEDPCIEGCRSELLQAVNLSQCCTEEVLAMSGAVNSHSNTTNVEDMTQIIKSTSHLCSNQCRTSSSSCSFYSDNKLLTKADDETVTKADQVVVVADDQILTKADDQVGTKADHYIGIMADDHLVTKTYDQALTKSDDDQIVTKADAQIVTKADYQIVTKIDDCKVSKENDHIIIKTDEKCETSKDDPKRHPIACSQMKPPDTLGIFLPTVDYSDSESTSSESLSPPSAFPAGHNVSKQIQLVAAPIPQVSRADHQSSDTGCWSSTLATESRDINQHLALVLGDDDDDDILHELDAELLAEASRRRSPHRLTNGKLGRLPPAANGLQTLYDFNQMQEHNRHLLEQLKIRDEEIEKLRSERDTAQDKLTQIEDQQRTQNHKGDDFYLPQIKKLENTVMQQDIEIKMLKDKLVSHDSTAKKAVSTLQSELKSRVDQVTKKYEDVLKEKDMMVIRFAESEAKKMEIKQVADKLETKVKELLKDNVNLQNALKATKEDKIKYVTSFEMKCSEVSNLQKELEKMKEAVSSSDYRIKWFQNKLKDELESHKETKSNLDKTSAKLKEAREETEVIRKECQAIVKRYQESEEIKSVNLDKELKLKQTELQTHIQERNDTHEIHQLTKKELDSLKSQHQDAIDDLKALKDKIHSLEEERRNNHQMIENHQEIMQKQRAENADLKSKVQSYAELQEDYKRAQELIQSLDRDVADLKGANRDLQKDMESCSLRESGMLSLQSELSRTTAILRSECSSLSNKATLLTEEVERYKTEVQRLEATVKDLNEKCEEEKTKRKEEVDKIERVLAGKIQECSDFKQKWEDEVDNSKTLKRRHANNVKDLTRQLQQVRKRLDTLDGKVDSSSMGSRTNSNGSLNSIDNSSQQSTSAYHPPVQEFPVITEQLEVDKQLLIERIVRLQKSHARKNDKLEFLGEHIQQLLEEIRKKNKIIQCYALREEAGTMSSEDMDANKEIVYHMYKTLLARKGGIMASLYSVHQQDGSMTLDLSLQINSKLQAVLEDTLLKNITLKESLDTLGKEIARLSQENRRLQLSLQEAGHLT